MKVKIYTLSDPLTNKIRYIGRTKNSLKVRLSGHISKAKTSKRKSHKECWIISLTNKGFKPVIAQLTEIEGWEESYKLEQEIIAGLIESGEDLTNLHDRGVGGLLRDFSLEQKAKISKSVKKLHEEGKLNCGRKPVDVYNLNGDFIQSFDSYKVCAKYIGISEKHLQNSMRRKSKKLRDFQIVHKGSPKPGKWKQRTGSLITNYKIVHVFDISKKVHFEIESHTAASKFFNLCKLNHYLNKNKVIKNRYIVANARLKLDELLENLEADNQQPSLSSNTLEGSTTNSRYPSGV